MPGTGWNRLEIAEDLDCGRLLKFATLDGLLGKRKDEDDVVALLRGREVGDRGGSGGFAFDWFAGRGAAGEESGGCENGTEKIENGRRHSWVLGKLRRTGRFSIFHFQFSNFYRM